MASVSHLTKLFRAIASGDLTHAEAAAEEIAVAEDRIGHHAAAQLLRGSLRPNVKTSSSNGTSQAATLTVLHDALTRLSTETALSQLQLCDAVRAAIAELCLEWTNRERLMAARLPRCSRLLFYGPPGCGKSVTAAALARELSLPAYVVRFDAVVGAYLGQTAVHLRELFRFAESTPCVVLVDEVDALGKHRGDPLDVGELHRIVITLMQELEHVHPAGYIVATSNLPEQLDAALWRRFDVALEFPRPTRRELRRFGVAKAESLGVPLTAPLRDAVAEAKSYADAEKILQAEARRLLLGTLV